MQLKVSANGPLHALFLGGDKEEHRNNDCSVMVLLEDLDHIPSSQSTNQEQFYNPFRALAGAQVSAVIHHLSAFPSPLFLPLVLKIGL